MLLTTTDDVTGILPEQWGELVVQPVQKESVALQASTMVTTSDHKYHVPVQKSDPAAAWLVEGDEISPSDAVFDEQVVIPAKVGGLSIVSRELAEDSSPEAAATVGASLASDMAKKIDLAYFGSVASPAPDGLEDLTGMSTVDAGASWSNLDGFAEAQSKAEQVGATITNFVAHPADALLLAKLKDETGSNRPLLGSDPVNQTRRTIFGVALLVSPAVSAGTVWGLDRKFCVTVMRDDVRLEVSDQAYFSSDRVGVKSTMRLSWCWPHPASVVKVSLTP